MRQSFHNKEKWGCSLDLRGGRGERGDRKGKKQWKVKGHVLSYRCIGEEGHRINCNISSASVLMKGGTSLGNFCTPAVECSVVQHSILIMVKNGQENRCTYGYCLLNALKSHVSSTLM
jgi:hypothetical protein